MPDTFKLFTDGGSRNNPGPAAIGYVCYASNDTIFFQNKKYIGEQTNNYAEYMSLLTALNQAKQHAVKNVNCYLDSNLVVQQLNGKFKVKDPVLKTLYIQISALLKDFSFITFNYVPRAQNSVADGLVNEALDKELK